MSQQAVTRIAVLRALQLGDLLCAVPAFRALRVALPDSEITLIGLPWARSFVNRFHRYIDSFLEFPGYPGLSERTPDLAAIPWFLAHAQSLRFDLVLQMHGSGEITNPVALLLGGRRTAGFYQAGQYCPDGTSFFTYPAKEPEIRRQLHLLRLLGTPSRGEFLEFPLTENDRRDARDVIGAAKLLPSPYVCVHPGARSADRRWPAEGFARLADHAAASGATIVLTGTRDESGIAHEVAQRMKVVPVDLVGRTSLGALAAIVSRARMVICNDTGVSHVADALSIPSVVIFTGSDPRRWAPLDTIRHRTVVASSSCCEPEAVTRAIFEIDDMLRAEGLHAA